MEVRFNLPVRCVEHAIKDDWLLETKEFDLPFSTGTAALVLVDVWDRIPLSSCAARAEKVVQKKIVPLLKVCRKFGMLVVHATDGVMAKNYAQYAGPARQVSRRISAWPPDSTHFCPPTDPSWNIYNVGVTKGTIPWRLHPAVFDELGTEPVVSDGLALHQLFEQRGIVSVFFVGFHTNACILFKDYSLTEISRMGYNAILFRDCVDSFGSKRFSPRAVNKAAIHMVESLWGFTALSTDLINGVS